MVRRHSAGIDYWFSTFSVGWEGPLQLGVTFISGCIWNLALKLDIYVGGALVGWRLPLFVLDGFSQWDLSSLTGPDLLPD